MHYFYKHPLTNIPTFQQIIDQRSQKIPGGASVQKLVGKQPHNICHQGQSGGSGSASKAAKVVRRMADETVLDMSVASVDVSVQVLQNCQR